MSRDWTPFEHFLSEQRSISEGRGDLFDFMESLKLYTVNPSDGKTNKDEPIVLHSAEDMALRKQFPYLGKYLFEDFNVLYDRISRFNDGVAFLHQKDKELGEIIVALERSNVRDSYLKKWFFGELDENFYYNIRNNELLIDSICSEAREKGLSNWTLTDSDCLQFRRQVGFCDSGIFELMQVDTYDLDGRKVYKLAVAEIDLTDYSDKERDSALNMYGYDNIKAFVSAVGSWEAAYGELAEMLFEISSAEHYVMEFQSWNDALAEVERRTGERLNAFRESDSIPLDDVIKEASSFQVSVQPEECGSIKDTELSER